MPWYSDEELRLRNKLLAAIAESELSYQEAMSALNYVSTIIREKGNNLLDGTNIQEVVKQEKVANQAHF